MKITITEDDVSIQRCFAVMSQLRPHLDAEGFVARVRRQMEQGYRLAMLEADGKVQCLAGYRVVENLAWGKHVYVDDLVTDSGGRSLGCGAAMMAWLIEEVRQQGCAELHLDSGVQRFGAHRFYLREGMDITSHHFAMKV